MKVKDNKRIYIIVSLILLFIILFVFTVFNNKIESTKANLFEISNDDISISINDTNSYGDNIAEFYFYDLKTVEITVDFKDTVSKNKKIEIDLNEGLTYKMYPVLSKTDEDMHTLITETTSLHSAISDVSYPEIQKLEYKPSSLAPAQNKTSFGKLTYNVKENISKLKLSINIMVDWHKIYPSEKNKETGIYENKIIEDAIKVTAYKNNEKINEISSNISIKTDDSYNLIFVKNDYAYNKSIFASTNDEIKYGYTRGNSFRLQIQDEGVFFGFPNYKKIEYTFYYPKGTEFVDIVNSYDKKSIGKCNYNDGDKYCNIQNIPGEGDEDNKVILTTNAYILQIDSFSIKYSVKTVDNIDFNDKGVFESNGKQKDNVKITFYDDIERIYYSQTNSLQILHPDNFINKMGIKSSDNINDDKNDDTYVYGPAFVIENTTPGTKTNQVLEYIIDPNYEAIAVTFPKPSGGTVKDIQYKTNKNDEWQSFTENKNANRFSLEDAKISLDSDIYFTRVKATIVSYPENYYSSVSAPFSNFNAVVYGNLKSTEKEADVTFRMYNKDDTKVTDEPCALDASGNVVAPTEVCSTKKVYYTSVLTSAVKQGTVSFFSEDNKTISKISQREKFYIKGNLSTHTYPYGTRLYMDNAEVYLREPRGLTLDVSSINLSDENNVKLIFDTEIKENKFGEKVYILKTNKTIGHGLSKKETLNNSSRYIHIEARYLVNYNCELNSIALNDLIAIGNPNYKYASTRKSDDKDLDADGITDYVNDNGNTVYDIISNVSSLVLVVEPKKEFSVYSYVNNGETIYGEYIENVPDTIIEVNPNNEFEYVIDIRNNSEDSIDSYEIYIPIAKKGTNYGTRYQKDAFGFDVSLLEELSSNELYDVYYSIDKDTLNVIDPKNMNYVSHINDKTLVTMVKIVSKKKINIGEKYSFGLKIKVEKNKGNDETALNINNIVYDIASTTLTGTFKSNSNAFKLYAPSISGYIFNDLNMDKKYDNKDIPVIGDTSLELYKLNKETYEKVTDINVNPKDGYFVIDDTNILDKNIYALKVNVNDYNLYSDITYDGWIKDISLLESKAYYYEIGYIKYDLDFSIEDEIIGVGEKKEISVKDIKPDYFDLIKNEESAYFWNISEEDSKYLKVYDKNGSRIEIEGLKETKEDVKVCVTVVDRYNNKKEKCAKVKVKESLSPIVKAEDARILVGSKIKYEEYLKEAIDYKDNKIKLDFNKNVKVTSDIIHENGIATKVGAYNVTYEVTDDYGNIGKTRIKIYVDPVSAIITNPSTYDNVIINIIVIIISLVTVITTGIFIYKKRYRN